MSKNLKNTPLLFLTAIIWGFAFVAQLDSATKIGGFTYNGTRFMLGALSLVPVILIFDRGKQFAGFNKHLQKGLVAGILLFTASSLQQIGIIITNSAGKAGFMTGLYTVLVPVISFLFLKKKSSINIWLGAALALSGLFMLCILGSTTNSSGETSENVGMIVEFIKGAVPSSAFEWVGMGLLFISAIFWALHIIYIDSVIADLSSLKFSAVQFMVCSLLSWCVALITEVTSVASTWAQITDAGIAILYGGILSVGVAYTCQSIGQRGANPTYAAIVLSTESIFSAIGEMLFYILLLGQTDYVGLGPWGYAGCAVMFGGIVVSQLEFKKRTKVNT